jgi:hypothetical protein
LEDEGSDCRTDISFLYTDFFEGANSKYCCPHRSSCVIINGTGGTFSSPNTAAQSYQIPVQEIGLATLNDGPFGVGLTMRVDPSFLRRGHLVTLYMLWFLDGTCTGTEVNGHATCVLSDVENFDSNGMGLFASGMVPLNDSPLILSGYYPLPSRSWQLNSTLNYELQFRLSDNGAFQVLPSAQAQNENFYRQWTSGANVQNLMARFPPRKEYESEM